MIFKTTSHVYGRKSISAGSHRVTPRIGMSGFGGVAELTSDEENEWCNSNHHICLPSMLSYGGTSSADTIYSSECRKAEYVI